MINRHESLPEKNISSNNTSLKINLVSDRTAIIENISLSKFTPADWEALEIALEKNQIDTLICRAVNCETMDEANRFFSMLTHAKNIRDLTISKSNLIDSCPGAAIDFFEQANLISLNLKGSKLEHLTSAAFVRLVKAFDKAGIQTLNLANTLCTFGWHNPIWSEAFSNTHFRSIDFSENLLNVFSIESLENLFSAFEDINLEELYLRENYLTHQLQNHPRKFVSSLSHLKNLKVLDVTNNQITDLRSIVLADLLLNALKSLNIPNLLLDITCDCFRQLTPTVFDKLKNEAPDTELTDEEKKLKLLINAKDKFNITILDASVTRFSQLDPNYTNQQYWSEVGISLTHYNFSHSIYRYIEAPEKKWQELFYFIRSSKIETIDFSFCQLETIPPEYLISLAHALKAAGVKKIILEGNNFSHPNRIADILKFLEISGATSVDIIDSVFTHAQKQNIKKVIGKNNMICSLKQGIIHSIWYEANSELAKKFRADANNNNDGSSNLPTDLKNEVQQRKRDIKF